MMTATYTGDPNYTSSNANATINVTGPYVNLSPPSLTFPNTAIGSSSGPQTVIVKNVGTDSLTISGISASDIWGGYKETNDCSATLIVGAFCTVSVTFAPTFQESLPARLLIINNAANSPQIVPLNGTSYTTAPAITLSSTTLNFPNTALNTASTAQSILVTNLGTATLSISGISISGTNPNSFTQTNNCATVAANISCTISVTFTPLSFGTQSAIVAITDNASNSPQYINLSGDGVELGTFTLSGSPVALTVGASGKSTITATPSGGYTGTITLNSCVEASSPNRCGRLSFGAITSATVTAGAVPTNGSVTISTIGPHANYAVHRGPTRVFWAQQVALFLDSVFFCPRLRNRGNLVLIILLGIFGLRRFLDVAEVAEVAEVAVAVAIQEIPVPLVGAMPSR